MEKKMINKIVCEARRVSVEPFMYEGLDLKYRWLGKCLIFSDYLKLIGYPGMKQSRTLKEW